MNIKPYIMIFKAHLSKEMSYRFNFVFSYLLQITRLLIALSVWSLIFSEHRSIHHYSWHTIAWYYGFSSIFLILCYPSHMFELQPLIRKGALSALIIKPLNIEGHIFAKFAATKLPAFLILSVLIFSVFFFLGITFHASLSLPTLFLISISFFLTFFFGLFMSVLAFWLIEMWPLKRIFQGCMALLGGGIAPLDLLPESLLAVALWTPFPYLGYFNVKAIQGTLPEGELLQHCIIALGWTALFSLLFKILWKVGLQRYEAVNL